MRTSKLSLPLIAAALVAIAPGSLAADEVYRWVDEDGVVHFSDSAEGIPNDAEVIDVPSESRGQAETMPPATTTAPQAEEGPSYAQQRRDERAEARRKAAEERQQIEATCAEARSRVAALEPSTHVLVEGEDGTVKRLEDDARLELLDEAKAYIAQNCNN
jgi:hypothetical protein